ncbi:MAG: glycosyl hydrolase family 18 protein [Halanaerobium sp.]|nr:glycosyl hydrolase family 18 protein [Halanaerobium sp.]
MMQFFHHRRNKQIALLLILTFLFTFIGPSIYQQRALAEEKETKAFISGIILMGLAYLFDRLVNRDGQPAENNNSRIGDIWREGNVEQLGKKEVLGFFVNWTYPLTLSFPALRANSNSINYVAPFWYTLNSLGHLKNKYEGQLPEVVRWAKKNDQKIIPLINNEDGNYTFLTDSTTRKRAIKNIVNLIISQGYDGVNLDFEFIPPWTRDSYTTFVRELAKELHPLGKTLTISVFPKIDVPVEFQAAYDYSALAPYIDRMVIMTYDHHWSSGPPGPIAPIGWVKENIDYALNYVPASKILLGVANYAYDWPTLNVNSARNMSAKEAIIQAQEKGAEIKWDEESQSPYYYYWEGTHKRIVWFENSFSLRYKLQLVNKYDLAGIAIWRLGNAEDRFWDVIREELK